jgi:hypothetical protein
MLTRLCEGWSDVNRCGLGGRTHCAVAQSQESLAGFGVAARPVTDHAERAGVAVMNVRCLLGRHDFVALCQAERADVMGRQNPLFDRCHRCGCERDRPICPPGPPGPVHGRPVTRTFALDLVRRPSRDVLTTCSSTRPSYI